MRLSHVTLHVADIARSRGFYERLGFALIVAADHYCRFIVGDGTTLSVEINEAPITPAAHICIEFDTPEALDAEIARLDASGVSIEQPSDKRWLWREARLIDPDGHVLIYFFAGPNKLDPPWRVRP